MANIAAPETDNTTEYVIATDETSAKKVAEMIRSGILMRLYNTKEAALFELKSWPLGLRTRYRVISVAMF